VKSKTPLIAVALVALVAACTVNISNPTTINVITTVTITLANPVPSSQAGCPAISKIRVSYPENLAVGSKAPISATPLDGDGNKRAANCDDADGISWSAQPTDLLRIEAPRAFDTQVEGLKKGDASLGVTVGKAATQSVGVKVG